jgi:transcriptional regulator with XRE-family HTH domain
VGKRLRKHRQARGLYAFQAAAHFNVSPSTWSRMETGQQEIPDMLLARIAQEWRAWDLLHGHPVYQAAVVSLADVRGLRALRGEPRIVTALEYDGGRLVRLDGWVPDPDGGPEGAPRRVA